MEERGHLGKKYEGESQETSSDLWGKIEPKIERKRRPFGLLWWLGLGGTMLLLVGLWKAGSETVVPVSNESKPLVHTKSSPKSSQTDVNQALSQKQNSLPRAESQSQKDSKLQAVSEAKSIDNQSSQDIASAIPYKNGGAQTQTISIQKSKSARNIGHSVQIKKPVSELPFLAKLEEGNVDNKTRKNPVDPKESDENLKAREKSTNSDRISDNLLIVMENPEKKANLSVIDEMPSGENLKKDSAPDLELNSQTSPPPNESMKESSISGGIDSTERTAQIDLSLNPVINSENQAFIDSTKKNFNADSLLVQNPDTSHSDSSRIAKSKNWKLGFSLGGFFTSKNMSINQNPEENRVELANKNAFTASRIAWSAAFWFQKSIHAQLNWYASLGVLFLQDQTDFRVQNDTILSFSERTDANGNKFLKPVYGEWNRSVQSRKLFLEVQAGLIYSNLAGPMGFKIGPGFNYLLWDDRKITENPASSGPEPASSSQILPSIHIGLPFSWRIGRNQHLDLEPSLSYFLSPAFHPYAGSDVKPFLAGLKIGFSW